MTILPDNEEFILNRKFQVIEDRQDLSLAYKNDLLQQLNSCSSEERDEFFKTYSSFKNNTQELEFILGVKSLGLSKMKDITNEVNGSFYLKENSNEKMGKFLSKSKQGIKNTETTVEYIEDFIKYKMKNEDYSLPFAKVALDTLKLYQGIGQFWHTTEELNEKYRLDNNEINHPELRSIASAFVFDDKAKIERYFEYHKTLGNSQSFVSDEMTLDKYTANVAQAAICYASLPYEVKKILKHIPLHELGSMLNRPFTKISTKFSFDNNNSNKKNIITPDNIKNSIYKTLILAEYHYTNIKQLHEEVEKNPKHKLFGKTRVEIGNMYFDNKLPNSKLENDIEKYRKKEQHDFVVSYREKFETNIDLSDKSKQKKQSGNLRFHLNKLDVAPNNGEVISSFVMASNELKKAAVTALSLNLSGPDLMKIRYLQKIVDKLKDTLEESEHAKSLGSRTLVNPNIITVNGLKTLDFTYILNKDIRNQTMKIGSVEKTFGEWISKVGERKRDIKENINLVENSKDGKLSEDMEKFISQIDTAVDFIFTNMQNNKLNNKQENYNNLKASGLKTPFPFVSMKSNLNDYSKQEQIQNVEIAKKLYSFARITMGFAGKFEKFAEKIIEIAKNALLSLQQQDYVKNSIPDIKFTPNIKDDAAKFRKDLTKSSGIRIWSMKQAIRYDYLKSKKSNLKENTDFNNTDNDLYIGNNYIDVKKRVEKISSREIEYIQNKKDFEKLSKKNP